LPQIVGLPCRPPNRNKADLDSLIEGARDPAVLFVLFDKPRMAPGS
jgi:hypothetical protein